MTKLELSIKELTYLAGVCAGLVGVPPDHPNSKALAKKLRNMRDEKLYGTPSASGYSLSR